MRKNNNYGFTLAELLIVVAIIAVLVAISIPIFGTQLERSREAVDAANIRSQYAQVITDAILDGGDVNGKEKYGAVNLKQQQTDWQNTEMKTNLHSNYNEVVGTPAAGGIAWVEYKAAEDSVILHYEGGSSSDGGSSGGGSSSGGSGTDTGGDTDSGSGGGTDSGSGEASSVLDISTASPYPERPTEDSVNVTLQMGKRYVYNGTLYIAKANKTFSKYYYIIPGNSDDYVTVKPSGKVLSDNNFNDPQHIESGGLNVGDIYVTSDGKKYIRLIGDCEGQSPTHDSDPSRWVEIID